MEVLKNLGRSEVSTASIFFKKIYQAWRFITNFNFPGKSKKNVEAHYDIGGRKGEILYDVMLDKHHRHCLLYTSDAADDSTRVDLGGRRIIKKRFFSSRRRHTRCSIVSWARRCV